MPSVKLVAEPEPLSIDLNKAALVIIDMQRDFLEPGGFGAALGNDVSRLQAAVPPLREVLGAARVPGCWSFIHGKATGLISPMHRRTRSNAAIPQRASAREALWAASWSEASPATTSFPNSIRCRTEPVIDKPGKGAFYQTDLELMLRNRGIDTLFVCGVTTEVCVNTTVREANDRGFRCIVLSDCCASYFPEFHEAGLAMIKAQGGIFGSVAGSKPFLTSLAAAS